MGFSKLALVALPPLGGLHPRSTLGQPSHAFIGLWAMVLCRSGVGDGGSGWASICERGAGRLMDEAYELELARGLPLASRVRAQLLGNGRFWEDR